MLFVDALCSKVCDLEGCTVCQRPTELLGVVSQDFGGDSMLVTVAHQCGSCRRVMETMRAYGEGAERFLAWIVRERRGPGPDVSGAVH